MMKSINGCSDKNQISETKQDKDMEREFERCADIVDQADVHIENAINDGVCAASRAVAMMPPGAPGECSECGMYFSRVIDGVCCRCIDLMIDSRVRNG